MVHSTYCRVSARELTIITDIFMYPMNDAKHYLIVLKGLHEIFTKQFRVHFIQRLKKDITLLSYIIASYVTMQFHQEYNSCKNS